MASLFDLSVHNIHQNLHKYVLVDVREPDELKGPEGFIEGSILATLGTALSHFLQEADRDLEYVFICRSGKRSAQTCELASLMGLKAYNMAGGMLAWKEMDDCKKNNTF